MRNLSKENQFFVFGICILSIALQRCNYQTGRTVSLMLNRFKSQADLYLMYYS